MNSEKLWETKNLPVSIADIQSTSVSTYSERSNCSVLFVAADTNSAEKGKTSRTDSKAGTNGTWLNKSKKYNGNICHNHASCSVNSSQASGENSLNCLRFPGYSNKKKLSRKDSLNVNISARKDGQVIIGR